MEEQGAYNVLDDYLDPHKDYPGKLKGAKKLKDIADREEEQDMVQDMVYRSNFISLVFMRYPELRDWLYERAKEEVRDVDGQIIWICKQAMESVRKVEAYLEKKKKEGDS
jgi:hypothetical protein